LLDGVLSLARSTEKAAWSAAFFYSAFSSFFFKAFSANLSSAATFFS
jgi:hypothetical protein